MRTSWLLFPTVLLAISACSNGGNGYTGGATGTTGTPGATGTPDCTGGCTAGNPGPERTVALDALQVVGGSIEIGTGLGRVILDRDNATIQGSIVLINVDATEVTLNRGFAGEDGPVLSHLNKVPGGTWSLPRSVLTAGDLVAFDSGGLYVNVTNDRSPAGAVRGQVVPSGAFVNIRSYTLFGSQVVPAIEAAATASSALTRISGVDQGDTIGGTWNLVIHVNVHGLDDVTSVHVHEAHAGRNGPITLALMQDSVDPGHWFSERSAVDELAEAALAEVHCSTRGACNAPLYLDVHTLSHPDGALRAQIAPALDVRFVSLSGDDVVPGIQSDRSGMAAVTFTGFREDGGWDWIPERMFNVNLDGVADATGVTLNYAPVGQVGPAAVSLQRVSSVAGLWTTGIIDLEEAPDSAGGHGWYLNVTTPAFPDGELRGQWSTQVDGYRPDSGFIAWNMDPADGATLASMPGVITVEFNRDILPESATFDTVELLASGGDASFNEGNEWPITLVHVAATDATMAVTPDPGSGLDDVYQLRVSSIRDAETEQVLDSAFIGTFAVNASVPSPTFAELQDQVFTPSCAQTGCHGGPRPAFGLDLSAGAAFANMVGAASAEQPGLKLVEPGDQNASYVIRKLLRPDWDPHPAGQPRLSNASLQKLRQWIDEGAQDN